MTWSKGAFGDTIDTVRATAVELTETVPVHTGTVELHGVLDGDLESISPIGVDGWTRVLSIDQQTWLVPVTIWAACGIGHLESVRHDVASSWMFLVEVGSDAETAAPARPCERTIRASGVCNKRGSG